MFAPWKKSFDKPREHIKEQRHYFADKRPCGQSYGFSSSHVWMWELDHKESWVLKNWCFWTVVLEKTLESSLYCKEIKAANPEGNQSWIVIGRTDAEAPVIWPPDAKTQFIVRKRWMALKTWQQQLHTINTRNKKEWRKKEQKKRKHELLRSESRKVVSVQILQVLNLLRKYYNQIYWQYI